MLAKNGEELKNNALEPRAMMNQNIFGHDFFPIQSNTCFHAEVLTYLIEIRYL